MGAGSIEVLEGVLGCELGEAAEVLDGRGSRSQFVVSDPHERTTSRLTEPENGESPGFPGLS